MKVTLARVDERLIHGQVMTAWCKKCWIKTIILVDKEIAQDEFMISVLEMSAPAGVKVIVKSPSDVVALLANDSSDDSTLLLFKDIDNVDELVKHGYPLKELNIGNVGSSSIRKPITREVYVSQQEKEILRNLSQSGVNVYIQKLPGDNSVDIMTKI